MKDYIFFDEFYAENGHLDTKEKAIATFLLIQDIQVQWKEFCRRSHIHHLDPALNHTAYRLFLWTVKYKAIYEWYKENRRNFIYPKDADHPATDYDFTIKTGYEKTKNGTYVDEPRYRKVANVSMSAKTQET